MAKVTPEQAAQRWAQGLAQAGPKIEAGVMAVTTSPGQAAARQKVAYTQNVAQAADKWASRVAAVPLQSWQQATIEKGTPRIASGAQAAEPKMAQFMGQFLPFVDSTVQSLPPRGSLDQNIARMTDFVRKASRFQRR
jgi:hypothetical protein